MIVSSVSYMCPPAVTEPALLCGVVRAQDTHPTYLWLRHYEGRVGLQLLAHHGYDPVSILVK